LFWLRGSLGASHIRIFVEAFAAQYFAAGFDSGHDWNGRSDFGGVDTEFLGAGSFWRRFQVGGAMLNDARGHLFDAPHLVVFSGVWR